MDTASHLMRMGETGETYILNRDKLMITESRFLDDVILKQVVDTEIVHRTENQGDTDLDNYPDYRGIPVFGATAVIKDMDWTVITEVDFAEAFIPIRKLQIKIIIIGGILIPGIFFTTWLLTSRLTKPILRIVQANRAVIHGDQTLVFIPDNEIPDDELGDVIQSRNRMLTKLKMDEKLLELKTAELQQSEEKYRLLIENIPDVIWVSDQKGKIIFISTNVETFCGYTPEEFYERGSALWFERIHPEDIAKVRQAYESLFASDERYDVEYRVRRKNGDGEWIWLNDRAITTYEKDGITYAEGVFSDITERKQIEKLLHESKEQLQSILDNTTAVIYIKDTSGRYLLVNRQIEKILHMTREEIVGKTDMELWPEETADAYRKNDLRVLEAKAALKFEEVAQQESGLHTYLSVKFPLFDPAGAIYAVCGISTDITERIRMEESLRQNEARLANAQQIAHLGNWEWNIVTNELRWSDEIYRIFGLTPQSFGATYEAFLNAVHPDDREFVKESVNKALYEKMPYSIDYRIVLPDGTERIVHEQAEVIFDIDGKAVQMNGTVQDVTEHKRAEEEIRRLFTAIDQSINNVFITDSKGCIEYVNATFEHVTGYAKEEVIGQNPRILASGETTHAEYEELWGTITAGKTWRGIFKNKKKNGQYYWGNGLITPIRNEKGKLTHFLAIQEDVTEKIKAEERLKYLASYDELTGLRNRACFMEQLHEWLSHNKTYNQTGSLLLIDIDGFRLINDTYGHSTGDTILHRVAGFLITTLFEIDKHYVNKDVKESILSRMGGDEFAIYLPARDEEEGMKTAEEIRKRIEKFRFAEISSHITVSIGVVLYPRDGSTTKELITKADASLYHAKELGHNRVHLYHTQDLLLEKTHLRMEWKGRIQKAIEEKRFEPWFQPILDLKDNQIHHYEALARMRSTNGEIILPGAFVDTAETLGLITAIDRIIIKKALIVQSNLCKQGKNFSFSMNLSGKDLDDKEFLEFLRSAIAETRADPKHLIFEITETAAVRDIDRAIKFIRELRSIGCSISLDDFGVGFTSFKYLKEMEVDYIKIDGSFIRKLHETRSDHIFVKAMADVARSMGIKTIAEFVENNEIIKILKEYGVDYGQGYFIGKPSPNI